MSGPLVLALLLVPLAAALWLLLRDRPEPPPGPSWVNHESVLKAVQHGEIVRASEAFNVGTERGQFQTIEADPRDRLAHSIQVAGDVGLSGSVLHQSEPERRTVGNGVHCADPGNPRRLVLGGLIA